MWSSWNYVGPGGGFGPCSVTYWMNLLQGLNTDAPLFVTLNPHREPRPGSMVHVERYEHPLFDAAAVRAQRRLWSLQGVGGVWFCGAHFGAGFHEDGLQAGLAVAEQLGGLRRPWTVDGESDRIHLSAPHELVRQAA
jgi:predicted NAD/FAD-binding protein